MRIAEACGARVHDEHEGGHEEGEEDLHGVLEEGHEVADLDVPRSMRIAPNQMMAMVVMFMTNIMSGMISANILLTRMETCVRSRLASSNRCFSSLDPVEGADDAHAGEPFAEHEVDLVDLLLDGAEQGEAPDGDRDDDPGEDGDDHDDDPGQTRVLGDGHDHAADRP